MGNALLFRLRKRVDQIANALLPRNRYQYWGACWNSIGVEVSEDQINRACKLPQESFYERCKRRAALNCIELLRDNSRTMPLRIGHRNLAEQFTVRVHRLGAGKPR